MVNSISFGSTYKAYITKDDIREGKDFPDKLIQYLEDNNIRYSQSPIEAKRTPTYSNPFKTDKSSQFIPSINDYAVNKCTITAPDSKDADIETILANSGIKYEKIGTDNITTPSAIKKRILPAPEGYTLAYVDSQKLEELIQNQSNNFEHCKKDYDNYFKEETEHVLKSGDDFSAQTLSIKYLSDDSTPESLSEYVDRYGQENLNPDSVAIWQEQRGVSSYTNMYYGLKDLGFKNIPVYMSKESYQNAKTLGLLK